jgi:anti-sigma regulatory factor (Ser/Thr protein kinase)
VEMQFAQALPKHARAPAEARRTLDRLAGDVDDRRLDDARLLVSELVTNSVVHVREEGEIEVRVDDTEERLRVEVSDPGPGFASPRRTGWGLRFLARLADRWAAEVNGRARVWFELRAR